jgi:hypothetical protein
MEKLAVNSLQKIDPLTELRRSWAITHVHLQGDRRAAARTDAGELRLAAGSTGCRAGRAMPTRDAGESYLEFAG